MRIDILTLFPEMLCGPLNESILKQAREKGILDVRLVDIRDFALDKHRTADDYQYGGGSGMVMKPGPVLDALESVMADSSKESTAVVLLSARGRQFDQATALEFSRHSRMVLICGRYKGVDERVLGAVTDEISIGDYVLTGGELGAMILVDAVTRLIPGVLGDIESAETDSFYEGILGPPVYTRPDEFRGMHVPEVLLSGNHERIRRWRREQALRVTLERRPDLLEKADLTDEDREILREMETEQ